MTPKLRVAIVGGGGFMGKVHSMAWSIVSMADPHGLEIDKVVLVERDEPTAKSAAQQFGWAEHSDSLTKTLERDDIDVVDVVTPAATHEPIAIAAAKAGKHVLCEKPMSPDPLGAQRMAEAAAEAGVVNQIGFCYRHAAALIHAKQLLVAGELGRVLQLRISYLMDYAFSQSDWGRLKGAIGSNDDIGPHLVDLAQYLCGDIARVSGRLTSNTEELVELGAVPAATTAGAFAVDDAGVFLAEFANGALGVFAHSLHAHGRHNRIHFELDASKGALAFDWNTRDQIEVSHVPQTANTGPLQVVHMGPGNDGFWWPEAGMGSGYVDAHVNQLRGFIRAIVDGDQASPSFADALKVQRVVAAVAESSRDGGKWIDL